MISLRTLLPAIALTVASLAHAADGVDPKRLSDIVRTLASDELEGRGPGTPGEEKTVAYLTETFRKLGVEPGGENGGWIQRVPIVRTQIGTPQTLNVATGANVVNLTQAREVYVNTVRKVDRVTIREAPLVFVGHGVTAPERHWDDYKGV